ncbi:uncharacterized protein [Macrobrachium rosenbergii]|uniref:uncharacterized protein n=1 Tax=Macrobrachium rosenbergii TaxID=79674 RepID=UPI0034D5AD2A
MKLPQATHQGKDQTEERRTTRGDVLLPLELREESRYEHRGSTCFFIRDERSDTEFLNTRACRSFVPTSLNERLNPAPPTNLHISTASRAPLEMYGRRDMNVSFTGKDYSWTLTMADVTIAHQANEPPTHLHPHPCRHSGTTTLSKEYRYLFTIIDRNTRWPKAIPIQQQMAENCMKAIIRWVSRHGIPQIIMSDKGASFTSTLWNALTDSLGTKIAHATAYSPEAISIIERLHWLLKASLTARCQGGSWRKELPWVLLGLRTTLHVAFNASPGEVLYSQALTLPADVFQDQMSPTSSSDTRKAVERKMPTT